jgi:hypothetical protein
LLHLFEGPISTQTKKWGLIFIRPQV